MLWSLRTQNARVFNWSSLLSEWAASSDSQPPVPVATVLENLRSQSSPPVAHFLTYLNEEQDALKWFIYECVASSWMWNSGPRLYYIKEVLDYVDDLNSGFPAFPGSPGTNSTVRSFLTSSLTQEQLSYINMMPPLLNTTQYTEEECEEVEEQETCTCNLPPVSLHVIRSMDSSSDDDIVVIRKTGDDSYSYSYTDALSKCSSKKTVQEGLTSEEVMNQIGLMLNLLRADDEPFTAVQVFLPNMPTVLFKVSSLCSSTRDLLYDSLEAVLDSWPVNA
uniref:Uncharacterized protein n=1 Tax=viral metagenome TaxID=1070528 RepID=A0A6C0LAM8_9ZZZZ